MITMNLWLAIPLAIGGTYALLRFFPVQIRVLSMMKQNLELGVDCGQQRSGRWFVLELLYQIGSWTARICGLSPLGAGAYVWYQLLIERDVHGLWWLLAPLGILLAGVLTVGAIMHMMLWVGQLAHQQ